MLRCELNDEDVALEAVDCETLLSLDEALTKLAQEDAGLAKLVELRYFTGLTIEETAEILGVSPRTTKRNWAYARAWLKRAIDSRSDDSEN